jgi:hypothetical protein
MPLRSYNATPNSIVASRNIMCLDVPPDGTVFIYVSSDEAGAMCLRHKVLHYDACNIHLAFWKSIIKRRRGGNVRYKLPPRECKLEIPLTWPSYSIAISSSSNEMLVSNLSLISMSFLIHQLLYSSNKREGALSKLIVVLTRQNGLL